MPTVLDITRRSAESEYQKIAETLLRTREILFRIHLAEQVVLSDSPVECGDKAAESVLTDRLIKILVFHVRMALNGQQTESGFYLRTGMGIALPVASLDSTLVEITGILNAAQFL